MSNRIVMQHGNCSQPSPYHYTECGLDNVYLLNGYECEDYGGEEYVSVKAVEQLHNAIGLYLVSQRKALSGSEIRFLRKEMDLTQGDLADLLGTSDQSVARWEKEQSQIQSAAHTLLRLIYISHAKGEIDVDALVREFHARDDGPEVARLEFDGENWAAAA